MGLLILFVAVAVSMLPAFVVRALRYFASRRDAPSNSIERSQIERSQMHVLSAEDFIRQWKTPAEIWQKVKQRKLSESQSAPQSRSQRGDEE